MAKITITPETARLISKKYPSGFGSTIGLQEHVNKYLPKEYNITFHLDIDMTDIPLIYDYYLIGDEKDITWFLLNL